TACGTVRSTTGDRGRAPYRAEFSGGHELRVGVAPVPTTEFEAHRAGAEYGIVGGWPPRPCRPAAAWNPPSTTKYLVPGRPRSGDAPGLLGLYCRNEVTRLGRIQRRRHHPLPGLFKVAALF